MKNALEGAVRSIHRELRVRNPEFCTCARCEDDVLALALNQTKPRYVSENSSLGTIVTGVHLSYDQLRAELTVLVYDAMRRVAKTPRHDEGGPTPVAP
jgi:competence protein ComFB